MTHMEWLKNESDIWVSKAIITPDQQAEIRAVYPESKSGSPVLILFAIIGSLLIGAGIILLFATNWWKMPVPLKIILAFIPLLVAQGLCLYTFLRKYDSSAYREGGAIFLSLSFFAVLALIGQIFHMPSDLHTYVLTCILFSLLGIYFFRAKAAAAIYVAGMVFVGWSLPGWVTAILLVLILPFFVMEILKTQNKSVLGYLMLLLAAAVTSSIAFCLEDIVGNLEMALVCGLGLLLLDAVFRRISRVYFLTAAKLFGISVILAALVYCSYDYSSGNSFNLKGPVSILVAAALYGVIRYTQMRKYERLKPMSSDLFAAAALLLYSTMFFGGLGANIILVMLGVYYIVLGSRKLTLKYLNFGMFLVIGVVVIRFFDSDMLFLWRGIVFIIMGAAFLTANLLMTKKKKEEHSL